VDPLSVQQLSKEWTPCWLFKAYLVWAVFARVRAASRDYYTRASILEWMRERQPLVWLSIKDGF
jgi:hypothetical protein